MVHGAPDSFSPYMSSRYSVWSLATQNYGMLLSKCHLNGVWCNTVWLLYSHHNPDYTWTPGRDYCYVIATFQSQFGHRTKTLKCWIIGQGAFCGLNNDVLGTKSMTVQKIIIAKVHSGVSSSYLRIHTLKFTGIVYTSSRWNVMSVQNISSYSVKTAFYCLFVYLSSGALSISQAQVSSDQPVLSLPQHTYIIAVLPVIALLVLCAVAGVFVYCICQPRSRTIIPPNTRPET